MDPLSISVSCVSLVATIGKVSLAANQFVREARYTRHDIENVKRELGSLSGVLEMLAEDTAKEEFKQFPPSLGKQISDIVANCNKVVVEIEETLSKYHKNSVLNQAIWAVNGKADVERLKSSLEIYKSALNLTLDMLSQ